MKWLQKVGEKLYNINNFNLTERSRFLMKITIEDKLSMCKEHIVEGRSLSHICERYGNYDISRLKYLLKIYQKHGEKPFVNRTDKYEKNTKLLLISRVKNGESIREVASDFGLIDPSILKDWKAKYDKFGEDSIRDTNPRKNYLSKDTRYKHIIDKNLEKENERLKAEIDYLKKSQSLAQKLEELTTKDKAKVVNELRTKYSLKVLLEITNMAPSVFYYQLKTLKNPNYKYEEITKEIEYLYLEKHKKRVGYQRIYIELKKQGHTIGKNKVLEIMRVKGYSRQKKINYRRYNSYAGEIGEILPNLINQDFKTDKPFDKAGTDITMFRVKTEAVYLSPLIDFNTREILAYEVGTDAQVKRVLNMLHKLKKNHQKHIKGMIIQSDQGVQYQNSRYSDSLKNLGIIQSMSRKGNCLDNSPTENFFGRLKTEMWHGQEYKFETADDLIKEIHEYIKYYNEVRIVSRLQMSPIEYRNQLLNMLK
jgi:transposase InsO family protein/transposase-like protein